MGPSAAVAAPSDAAPDAPADERDVPPSPATHPILRLLKAGESVFHTFLLTITVLCALRGAKPLYLALFGVETLSGTLLGPVHDKSGYWARYRPYTKSGLPAVRNDEGDHPKRVLSVPKHGWLAEKYRSSTGLEEVAVADHVTEDSLETLFCAM